MAAVGCYPVTTGTRDSRSTTMTERGRRLAVTTKVSDQRTGGRQRDSHHDHRETGDGRRKRLYGSTEATYIEPTLIAVAAEDQRRRTTTTEDYKLSVCLIYFYKVVL